MSIIVFILICLCDIKNILERIGGEPERRKD